ncbi:site-specific recombinase XerD [Micromonospora sagamiensis]|uniref:Site-specific recombinase XerD n=1 Tax=Micromonospora sagamiensis TaxID=47875 RepID=A0A562WBE5_9ACTN|nr:site-specific recombinase XerD [Micromonospora sagamiensis]
MELPSGSLRVRVYAGVDPLTGKRHYLTETVPAGRNAQREAEKVRTRFLNEVDEKRSPRTRATLNQLLDKWLDVADIEPTTRMGYENKLNKHVRPVLGKLSLNRLDAETLDSFYASLRRCRDRCGGKTSVTHRLAGDHTCTARCRPHVCKPLSPSSVRQIHWILSGALSRALRWRWIAVNPAAQAEPPAPPHPDPQPPNPTDAARIITESWRDPDWGALVWLAMTTGARRGELCALRWHHLDLAAGVLTLRRSAYLDANGELQEKDTKTHQQRRVALDPETVAVLTELHARYVDRLAQLDATADPADYVFSPEPDNSRGYRPDTITQRYGRLAKRLRIDSHIHALRHYSATELINAGVDVRTVAGRLGHGGGGTTTLRGLRGVALRIRPTRRRHPRRPDAATSFCTDASAFDERPLSTDCEGNTRSYPCWPTKTWRTTAHHLRVGYSLRRFRRHSPPSHGNSQGGRPGFCQSGPPGNREFLYARKSTLPKFILLASPGRMTTSRV